VLHIAKSCVGGPLALVAPALITLDVAGASPGWRWTTRRAGPTRAWQPRPQFRRGYGALYAEQVTQADKGCDFEFLARPGRNPEPDPH
jgi:dihydroxy-acid dehydratase